MSDTSGRGDKVRGAVEERLDGGRWENAIQQAISVAPLAEELRPWACSGFFVEGVLPLHLLVTKSYTPARMAATAVSRLPNAVTTTGMSGRRISRSYATTSTRAHVTVLCVIPVPSDRVPSRRIEKATAASGLATHGTPPVTVSDEAIPDGQPQPVPRPRFWW